jgi:hypothetical protein
MQSWKWRTNLCRQHPNEIFAKWVDEQIAVQSGASQDEEVLLCLLKPNRVDVLGGAGLLADQRK